MVLCSIGVILFSREAYFVVLEYYFVVHISIGVILFQNWNITLCRVCTEAVHSVAL